MFTYSNADILEHLKTSISVSIYLAVDVIIFSTAVQKILENIRMIESGVKCQRQSITWFC